MRLAAVEHMRPSNLEQALMDALDRYQGIITGSPVYFWVELVALIPGSDTRSLAAAADRLHSKDKIWKIKADLDPDNPSPKGPRYVAGIIERNRRGIPDSDVSHLGRYRVV